MSRRVRWFCRFVLALALAMLAHDVPHTRSAGAEPPSTSVPTIRYEIKKIEGWTVYVNKDHIKRQATIVDRALNLLRGDLINIEHRPPPRAVSRLRTVRIWIEEQEKFPVGLAYQVDVRELRRLGKNPDEARCIEIGSARNYLAWTLDQPSILLHEFGRAYHHQFVDGGFQNAEIKAAYDRVMKAKLYDSVMWWDGKYYKPHAMDNDREYFADASEAFFATNDHYPFVYPELLHHDPETAKLLEKYWGGKTPHPSEYQITLDR